MVRTSIGELLKGLNATSTSARNGFMGQGLKEPGRQRFGRPWSAPQDHPPASLKCDVRPACQPLRSVPRPTNARGAGAVPAGSPWQATQIVLVLYWNPLLLCTDLIRSIWIYCSINSNFPEIPYVA